MKPILTILTLILLFASCKKNDDSTKIQTAAPGSITVYSKGHVTTYGYTDKDDDIGYPHYIASEKHFIGKYRTQASAPYSWFSISIDNIDFSSQSLPATFPSASNTNADVVFESQYEPDNGYNTFQKTGKTSYNIYITVLSGSIKAKIKNTRLVSLLRSSSSTSQEMYIDSAIVNMPFYNK